MVVSHVPRFCGLLMGHLATQRVRRTVRACEMGTAACGSEFCSVALQASHSAWLALQVFLTSSEQHLDAQASEMGAAQLDKDAAQAGNFVAPLTCTYTGAAHSGGPALQVFLASIEQYLTARASELGAAQFDKDDALAVDFVAAAANLRCFNFGIACASLFAIKVGALLTQARLECSEHSGVAARAQGQRDTGRGGRCDVPRMAG